MNEFTFVSLHVIHGIDFIFNMIQFFELAHYYHVLL